jgi:hypothetical protein
MGDPIVLLIGPCEFVCVLFLMASGYELKSIFLDSALPTQARISLNRATTQPATRPDWDRFGP